MNWKEVIAALTAAGYTQAQIAERCKCAQPTINDLATGTTKDPRDSLGQALRAMHEEIRKPAKRKTARTA